MDDINTAISPMATQYANDQREIRRLRDENERMRKVLTAIVDADYWIPRSTLQLFASDALSMLSGDSDA